MARIKNVARHRSAQQSQKPSCSTPEILKAVIELGASNNQAHTKAPGEGWKKFLWDRGGSQGYSGGADAVPSLSAIKKDNPQEIHHGHAALRARGTNPGAYEVFAYPKLAFMRDWVEEMKPLLEAQEEKANALGTTLKDVAIGFYDHLISEVVGESEKPCSILVNISDCWSNSDVQLLMQSFRELRPTATFESVNECESTLIALGKEMPVGSFGVSVDYGHATMNIGIVEKLGDLSFKLHGRWEQHDAGAGLINLEVEKKVKSISREKNSKSGEENMFELLEVVDNMLKPNPKDLPTPRFSIPEEEWTEIMSAALEKYQNLAEQNARLIESAVGVAVEVVGERGLLRYTGRAVRGPPFREALEGMMKRAYPDIELIADKMKDVTAVLEGMMYISDHPVVLSTTRVPVSLWLRSDPDEPADDPQLRVIRAFTQGQDLQDTRSVKDRRTPSHPIHYELVTDKGEAPTLDLSTFGTPVNVQDEDIIEGDDDDLFAYTSASKVTAFGDFEHKLPDSTANRERCHVYLYAEISQVSVRFYGVYASDGHEIKELEKTPFEKVFSNGRLTSKWNSGHKGQDLKVVRLQQTARKEIVSTRSLKASPLVEEPLVGNTNTVSRSSQESEPENIHVGSRIGKLQAARKRKRSSGSGNSKASRIRRRADSLEL